MRLWDSFELALLIGVLFGCVQASLDLEYRIYNVGYIKAVGVSFYSDAGCTVEVNEINWGSVSVGSKSTRLLYAKNTGSTNATLSYRVENWMPPLAESALTFSWSYDGYIVFPLDAVAVMFRLDVGVAVDNISAFSFDIVVTATEA